LSQSEPKLPLVCVELRYALSGETSIPSNSSRASPTTLVGSTVGAGTPYPAVTSSHAASLPAVICVWPLNSETDPVIRTRSPIATAGFALAANTNSPSDALGVNSAPAESAVCTKKPRKPLPVALR
jgi:hypothetical protein